VESLDVSSVPVLLSCFPLRVKIAVSPEYDTVPEFMTHAEYTDGISQFTGWSDHLIISGCCT